jgi:hypothetical protein
MRGKQQGRRASGTFSIPAEILRGTSTGKYRATDHNLYPIKTPKLHKFNELEAIPKTLPKL